MNITVNAKERKSKCIEIHYPPIYELSIQIMSNLNIVHEKNKYNHNL